MSSSPSSHTNGTSVVKSFAELGSLIALEDLPALADTASEAADPHGQLVTPTVADAPRAPLNLAGLLAQLAEMSTGLEAMVRQDARARELAAIELAQYEALAAERLEAERALAEARQVRAAAEQLVVNAFTDELRVRAAEHVASARAAELACAELLAERTRAADELASRPHLARVLAERERHAQEQAERERQRDAERAQRLAAGLERAHQALRLEQPDQALRVLQPLDAEFPGHPELRRALDAAGWQLRRRAVAPAEEALRDVRSRAYRQDPEAGMARLADVVMDDVPDDLARQLFGIWSDLCLKVVQQRGWHGALRYSPQTSRGVVLARQDPGGPYEVVSALGLHEWHVGQVVTAPHVLRASRPLQERRRSASES